jgi:hypothetical protein
MLPTLHKVTNRGNRGVEVAVGGYLVSRRVGRRAEVASDLFSMVLRRHKDVPVKRRIPVRERDRALVFVHDVMLVLRVTDQHLADEAASL